MLRNLYASSDIVTIMVMIQSSATTVAELLQDTRRAAGLSTRAIAPKVGVSFTTVAKWERGMGEPSVSQFIEWALATDQAPEQLLQGLIEMKRARRDSNPQPSDLESDPFWTVDRTVVWLEFSCQDYLDVESPRSGGWV